MGQKYSYREKEANLQLNRKKHNNLSYPILSYIYPLEDGKPTALYVKEKKKC